MVGFGWFSLRDTMSLQAVQALNAQASLIGKQAVVFGGTSGIGQGIALRLAQGQASVAIVGRNAERGRELVKEMKALAPNGDHEFISCDASLLSSIAGFATGFLRNHRRLDYLVISSGIATIQGRTETPEKIDQKLALHYFGRMAIIQGLLPLLQSTAREPNADVRVMSVLSGGVHSVYADFKKDFELKDSYSIKNAADAAGLYNDLGLDALARAHSDITFIHAAPGFVNTNWGTEMPWFIKGLVRLIQPLGTSIRDCGEFMTYGLLNPAYKGGLRILGSKGQVANVTSVHSSANADFVWEQTLQVLAKSSPKT